MTRTEFEHTVAKIRTRMLGMAKRFTRASGIGMDEEDIVQEALTELWLLSEAGYQIHNAEALAMKITKTVCVRHYRKRRPQTVSIDCMDCPDGATASDQIDLEEALRLREQLLGQLNAMQRLYLEMRNERGLSLDDIAAATGHPKSSVKATLSQARRILNEMLKRI